MKAGETLQSRHYIIEEGKGFVMQFEVGDRVLILCDNIPGTHIYIPHGTKGTILEAPAIGRGVDLYRIRIDERRERGGWLFRTRHFKLEREREFLPEPDFSLEEIEIAEKLVAMPESQGQPW